MLRQCCMLLRKAPNLHLSSRQSLEPPPYFFTHEPQPHARTSSFPKPKIRESASPTRNSTHLKTPTQQPKLPTSKIPCCSSFQCIYMYITKLASDNNQWRDPPSPLPPSFPASPSFFLTPPFLHNHHPHLPPIPPYSSKNGGNTPRVSNQRPRKNNSQYAAGKTHLVRFDLVPLGSARSSSDFLRSFPPRPRGSVLVSDGPSLFCTRVVHIHDFARSFFGSPAAKCELKGSRAADARPK